jgi:hypothetical protein
MARVVTSAIANNTRTVEMLNSGRRSKSLRGSFARPALSVLSLALRSRGALEGIAIADAGRKLGKVSSAVELGNVKAISNPSSNSVTIGWN